MSEQTRNRELWLDHLRHMLGATINTPKKRHGYRNHFCAGIGFADHTEMLLMAAAGLVRPGRIINDGCDQYFHATLAGCQAIGLHKAAIKRALED